MLSACNDNSQSKRINATDATQPIAMQCLELQSQCDFELADGRAQVLFDVKKTIGLTFPFIVPISGMEI